MKVIIIGSKGFIGEHLYNYYQVKGNEVWGADVIVTYVNKGCYFLIDASNTDFNHVFQYRQYDLCVNCSGASSVPESLKFPLRDYYLNTVVVFKLLEAIKTHQPACRFLNLSSAAVYGNPEQLPIKESAKTNPLSPYGMHKLMAEQICKEFNDFYNIKTCNIRIFSVYGNGLKKQLFWDIYNKAKTGNPFALYGTGFESRDFINVFDVVRSIELISQFTDFNADIYNVANGEEILIKDAVSLFLNFFNYEVNYSFSGEIRAGDPNNWKADISKLRALGYQPSVDMSNGLKLYYEWIMNNYK